jgi:predicted nucleic acid-binding protein
MTPPRVFIDSSVLFSAIYSTSGRSNDLLIMVAIGKALAVISDFVVIETRRNISELEPEKLSRLEQVLSSGHFEIVTVTPNDVADAKRWIVLKDAPVLAAAKVARVNMLVTLDKKHFLGRPELETYIGTPILTPAQACQKITASL